MKVPSPQHAPSLRLVGAHLGLGLAGSAAFAAALVARSPALDGYFFQPHLLGLVHLCVLGWLLPIALGGLHQLVPVLFEVPLRWPRLSWAALVLYVLGAMGLVGHLWMAAFGPGMPSCAALLAAALWLYAANLLGSLARTKVRSLAGAHVVASLAWLLAAATLGLVLSLHLWSPFLPLDHLQALRAHAHAAGLGFFGLLVMGVAYELLEMFLVSHGASRRAGWVAFVSINLGLVALVAAYLGGPQGVLGPASLALVAAGVAAFAVQVRVIVARRVRRGLDASFWLTASALGHLALAVALVATVWLVPLPAEVRDRVVLAYGIAALPGFLGSAVVGQLFKIVPFLVWVHRFSPLVGLRKLPTAAELLPERPRRVQGALLQAGLVGLAAGVLAGSPELRVAGAAAFAASTGLGLRSFWQVGARRP